MIDDATTATVREEARAWLIDDALPLWVEHGVDWRGKGFHESLTVDGLQSTASFKRLRVVTRQIYVFSLGARLGVGRCDAAMAHGLDFLFSDCRNPDGGFSSRFDLSGRTLDDRRDLYDLAFVIFALAKVYKVSPDPKLRQEAGTLVELIRVRMEHPAGGYLESLPTTLPRRQNPHMHLFEAVLAWIEVGCHDVFLDMAKGLAETFEKHFFRQEQGVLFEYFNDDLQPDVERPVVEPGHHFEWVWLLDRYHRLVGIRSSAALSLMAFALKHGVSAETGLLFGEVDASGRVLQRQVRVWPHTEWLKAEVVSGDPAGVEHAWGAIKRFLNSAPPGLWAEHWDPESQTFATPPAPATTLYHIAMAIECLLSESKPTVI